MLTLRLQRVGRSGYPQYRLIAQDSRRTPTSGKVAAYLGSYNPHSKAATFDKEKIDFYLKNGAQPSPRVAVLLKKEGVKLPSWVPAPVKKERTTKNPEKLRKNRPAEPAAEEKPAEPAEAEAPAETGDEEATDTTEAPKDEAAEAADTPESADVAAAEEKADEAAAA